MKNNTSHGFTLIETMVAVSILALSVAGPLFTASRALVAAEISRDQLTASYFAQEGIEIVRATRDDAYLTAYYSTSPNYGTNTSSAWGDFLDSPGTGTTGPYIPAGSQTSFMRMTQIYPTSLPTEKKITSTVTWSFHGTSYTVLVTDHLTSWQ